MTQIDVFSCDRCKVETKDPEKWIIFDGLLWIRNKEIRAVDGDTLHFCSPACVKAYLEGEP